MSIPDQYVDLLERSIKENRLLREAIVKSQESQIQVLKDITKANNRNVDDHTRRKRRKTSKIEVPLTCRVSFLYFKYFGQY